MTRLVATTRCWMLLLGLAACGGDELLQGQGGPIGGNAGGGLADPCAESEPVPCIRSCADQTPAGSGVCLSGPHLECPAGTVDPSTCRESPCDGAEPVTCVFSCADQVPVGQPLCTGGPGWACPDGTVDLARCPQAS